MALTVSEVAKLAHISVRTLHHYDEIGLLIPSARSAAGYRLYDDADLRKLQQILFFKELGLPLDEIARLVGDPESDVHAALRAQRELLVQRAAALTSLISAIDKALDAQERGTVMTKDEMFEVFEGFDPARYEEEAKERWGNSEAYRESAKRTARYTKEDWQRFKAESDAIYGGLAQLLQAGVPATSSQAMDLAEQHRLQIDRWFYPCSAQFHRNLGEMYVADARFTANIDRYAPGLSQYMRDAIHANADRTGA